MRSISALLIAICLFSSSGSSRLTKSAQTAKASDWGPSDSQRLAKHAYEALRAGRIEDAAAGFQAGYSASVTRGDTSAAIRFLSALAGCRFAQFRYREAVRAYSNAQAAAVRTGDYGQAALNALNASAVYAQMQNVHAAGQAAGDAVKLLSQANLPDQQAKALLQLGWIASLERRTSDAARLYRYGIRLANSRGDVQAEALGWHRLGAQFLQQGRLEAAEEALNKAFRLRLQSHDPQIDSSYYQLAELRLAQGDYRSAEQFADRAIATPASHRHLPAHRLFYLRGRARLARRNLEGSLGDFRAGLSDAEQWSAEVLPADSFRISAESMLAQLYSARIRSAAELYFATRDSRYLRESWQAAEANRAASLRARILSSSRDRLPPEYWERLAALHSVESKLLAARPPEAEVLRSQAESLRFRLTSLEMQAGISSPSFDARENFLTGISLKQFRKVLGNSRQLISFYLGDKTSYRWVIGPSETQLRRLPGREEISGMAMRFRSAVQHDEPAALAAGRRLYSVLFGGIPLSPRYWLVALDGDLFETPLAALTVDADGRLPGYLVEQVALEAVPGAWAVGAVEPSTQRGPFVALGDPIYNAADERLGTAERRAISTPTRLAAFRRGSNSVQLPRLVGSGAEITECARRWTVTPSIVLTGRSATASRLRTAIESHPSVIHIAAHFIRGGDDENRTVIALNLRRGSNSSAVPEVLTSADISSMHAPGSLVVLSGCGSGLGRVQAGSGLLGLARAWLAAGARAVVTSQWPVSDDTGELFQSFYARVNHATQTGDRLVPAEALRRAQVEMLQSRSWRSKPSYWAAYGLLGRSN